MAKYLRVDPDFDVENNRFLGANWRLPADADLDQMCADVGSALASGHSVTIVIEMADTPLQQSRLVINGSLVHSVLISETPEPGS